MFLILLLSLFLYFSPILKHFNSFTRHLNKLQRVLKSLGLTTYKSHQRKAVRSVNGYTKKLVAADQGWICKHCNSMLNASYEVDHVIPLWRGGSNNRTNLVALCRNCHGQKTFKENST